MDEDGFYHMFVLRPLHPRRPLHRCSIQCYQTNGQVMHATSTRAEGPFNTTTWAYNASVTLTNGSVSILARRERPQVLLDADGELQCVYNSAQACKGSWG